MSLTNSSESRFEVDALGRSEQFDAWIRPDQMTHPL